MRSSSSPFISPSGLVDKRLQPMWEQIEQVSSYLPQIAHVSYYLESLFNLDRNLTLLSDENVDHHILKDIRIFQGANAYELALVGGFVGTFEEWLASLKGEKGDTGLLDTEAYTSLLEDIETNRTGLAAALELIAANTARFADYVTIESFDAYKDALADQLDLLETSIIDTITPLIPVPPTPVEITQLAQEQITESLIGVNANLLDASARIDAVNALLDSLRDQLGINEVAFNEFLLENETTIGRLTAFEARAETSEASLVILELVTAEFASQQSILQAQNETHSATLATLNLVTAETAIQVTNLQATAGSLSTSITNLLTVTGETAQQLLVLQAESATHFGSISALNTVTSNTAIQINNLQVANNANFQAITELKEVVDAFEDLDTALFDSLALLPDQLSAVGELVLSLQVRLDETRIGLADLAQIDGIPIGAVINNLRGAIVDTQNALATEVGVLATRIDNNTAAIVAESTARSSAIAAEASQRALLSTRLQNAESAIVNERQSRVSADEALGQQIGGLTAQLYDLETGQAGSAQALTALTTRVRANENSLESLSTSVTQISANLTGLDGSINAQALAISGLTSRVRSTEDLVESFSSSIAGLTNSLVDSGGNTYAQSLAMSALTSRVSNVEGTVESISQYNIGLQNSLNSINGTLAAQSSTNSSLTSRITSTENSITVISSDLSTLTGTVSGLNSNFGGLASAIDAIELAINEAGGSIDVGLSSITSLATQITDLSNQSSANSLAITNLTSRVTSAEGVLTSLSSNVISLTSSLNNLNSNLSAQGSALNTLTTRVSVTEGSLSSLSGNVVSLSSSIGGINSNINAQATALNSLTTRMSATEGGLSAAVTDISQLQIALGELEASLDIVAGVAGNANSGLSAFYGLRGRAGTSEFEFAAFAGSGAPSTITLSADQIRFNGSVIVNGTLTADQLVSNAVTEKRRFNGSNVSVASNATFTNILSGNVPSAGGEVELEYQFDFSCPATVGVNVEVLVNGSVAASKNHYAPGPFTHTFQAFANFYCPNEASLVIRVKAQKSVGVGQSGCSVSYVSARTIEFKR